MDTKMLIIMQFSPVALHEMLVKLNFCNCQNDHFEPVFCRSVLDCTVSCLFLSHWQNIRARETTYYMLQSSITLPQTQSWKLTTELAPLFHSDNRTFAALQLKYLLRGYYTIFHRDFCEVHLHVQGSDCKFAVISLKRVSLLLSVHIFKSPLFHLSEANELNSFISMLQKAFFSARVNIFCLHLKLRIINLAGTFRV